MYDLEDFAYPFPSKQDSRNLDPTWRFICVAVPEKYKESLCLVSSPQGVHRMSEEEDWQVGAAVANITPPSPVPSMK